MSENVGCCELCGKRLVYQQTLVNYDAPLAPAQGEKSTVDYYQCPVDRDDPYYPNSHFYLKLIREYSDDESKRGIGELAYKNYHFDKFSVGVKFKSSKIITNKTQFFNPDRQGECMKSFDHAMSFEEILRYYKSWAMI